jgi:hypothetical protein
MSSYYFGFRAKPDGAWVPVGPYYTYDGALEAREAAKAPDAEVGNVYSAKDRAEAGTLAAHR